MDKPEVLVLTRSDIAELMTFSDYVDAVEMAFSLLASGNIPGMGVLDLPATDGMFHVKGATMPSDKKVYVAVKVNGNFPDNKNRFGLPTIQGAILLCDGIHGFPLALMESGEITMQRTGAATAIAARYLARGNAQTATICGCGAQATIQLMALKQTLPLNRVFAFDQDRARCERYCTRMQEEIGIPVIAVSRLQEATLQSDVVVTCTTSRHYYLKKGDIVAGAFVAAVGADSHDKHEIDPALMASSKVVADILDQCVRIGDLHHAIAAQVMTREDVHAELHEVISGAKTGRVSAQEIIIFDSTGTAIQDVASAAIAYTRALEQRRGTPVHLVR